MHLCAPLNLRHSIILMANSAIKFKACPVSRRGVVRFSDRTPLIIFSSNNVAASRRRVNLVFMTPASSGNKQVTLYCQNGWNSSRQRLYRENRLSYCVYFQISKSHKKLLFLVCLYFVCKRYKWEVIKFRLVARIFIWLQCQPIASE